MFGVCAAQESAVIPNIQQADPPLPVLTSPPSGALRFTPVFQHIPPSRNHIVQWDWPGYSLLLHSADRASTSSCGFRNTGGSINTPPWVFREGCLTHACRKADYKALLLCYSCVTRRDMLEIFTKRFILLAKTNPKHVKCTIIMMIMGIKFIIC